MSRSKRTRLTVRIDNPVADHLTKTALRKRVSVNELIAQILERALLEDGEAPHRSLGARLDRMQAEHDVLASQVGLFIRTWLSVTPSVPENEHEAAFKRGEERFRRFNAEVIQSLQTDAEDSADTA